MFRSATFRLTLWYLAIIMALSVLFSLAIYSLSNTELRAGLRRQENFFRNLPAYVGPQNDPGLQSLPDKQLELADDRLRLNLVLLNLGILVLAGGASYLLAKRTLRPIENALDAQGRFTADASHELRTPLTAMKSEIEVALRDGKLSSAEAKELLNSNLEEIAKLEALSNALLRLAQHDQTAAPHDSVSLVAVAHDAVKNLGKAMEQQGVYVNNQIKGGEVVGDRDSLVELFVILLDNAIKYSERGSAVTLGAKERGHSYEVSVADQGHGIKASDIPHLFERFYRADTSRSKHRVDGYGLGLSIAQKIVDVHHGTIEVTSKPGEGSTFTVKLPVPSR